MANWKCRFGLHNWIYIVAREKVAVGRKYFNRADYKICSICELVKDV